MAKRNSHKKQRSRAATRRAEPAAKSPPLTGELAERFCFAGLVALLVATPLVPSEGVALQGTGAVLAMMWTVLLAGWFLTKLAQGARSVRISLTGIAVIALVLIHSLSAVVVVATGQGSARPALNMLWQWISFGICFFLMRQLAQSAVRCRAVCSVMIALAVSLSALGYAQYFYEQPREQAAYRNASEHHKQEMIREAGIGHAPPGSAIRRQFEDRLYSNEPLATFALTNSLAGFLAPWLVVALAIGLSSATTPAQRGRLLAVLGVVAILIAGSLFLTKSRTAWLATSGGAVLLAVYGRSRGWRPGWKIPLLVCGVVALLGAGAVAVGAVDALVVSESGKSVQYRIEYWQATSAMILDHPWLGCGPGNFRDSYLAYKLPQTSEEIADPHNFILEIWATAGTFALVALIAVLVCFALHVRRLAARLSSEDQQQEKDLDHDAPSKRQIYLPAYGGALAGILLAFVAGLQFGMLWNMMLVCVPVLATCVALLHSWVARGRLSVCAPIIGMIVLLTNLLAAGGIGFPGVGQTWWVLMAIALNIVDVGRPGVQLGKLAIGALLLLGIILLAACYKTCFFAVVTYRRLEAQGIIAAEKGDMSQAVDCFVRASEVDPYSADAWLQLAVSYFRIWQFVDSMDRARADEAFQKFREAADQALRCAPRSHSRHRQVGDWYLLAYTASKAHHAEHLRAAIAAYQSAVDNYPNGAIGRAQLAWAHHLNGNTALARREAEEALRLDEINPHSEQKLKNDRVFTAQQNSAGSDQQTDNGLDAEQMMRQLRNSNTDSSI